MDPEQHLPPRKSDYIVLGYLDYTISSFQHYVRLNLSTSSGSLVSGLPVQGRDFKENYPREFAAITEINAAYSAVLSPIFQGHRPKIVGGIASYGSLRFRDGKIEVKALWLAAVVTTYVGVQGYPDFREGIIKIHEDISYAVEKLGSALDLGDTKFVPRTPEDIRRDAIQCLPPQNSRFRK
ncbi:hypothetical protein [Agrobacterium larrymoorei]|uniref:Uncharacterized protein n=1 Tax=Agrobacterium larrymoorei TaxID=160699 RepID=A0A4D7DX97_9HYPH|nr:hypothetical protein [Agrobacterium larrymoorei]QCJ00078.1 hypothetical protein CFBP5473_19265 [Agrobacterium larrymoorei]QYA09480.1 hypothetical protein J5285_19085 [Agrobacterium larrymoorei]